MKKTLFFVFAALLLAAPVKAQNITVEVSNLTHGIYFTPLLVAAHPEGTHLFQSGIPASVNLQAMAEGGEISGLISDLMAVSADIADNPAGGLLGPGLSASATFPKGGKNDFLSITAMLLPTNDGFVGLDALEIPKPKGVYTFYLNAYDAGTEANNEIINGGGAPGVLGIPADPGGNNGTGGTGITLTEKNKTVHIHRGVLGDTDLNGGPSDLTSTAHRWLNPVAKLVITVN